MNKKYWDNIAPRYRRQVHDSLASNRDGSLAAWLDRFRSRSQGAVDFGCGVGHYLRVLAARHRVVYALDHSSRCLDAARRAHRDLRNVIYRQADLSRPLPLWKRQRFGLCMNVLIAPDHQLRMRMLATMHQALTSGGHLLVLAPSLESALYVDTRLVEWNMRDGLSHRRAMQQAVRCEPGVIGHPVGGLVDRGGEPTKHYLREEAIVLLRASGFDVQEVDRVEYAWTEELHAPPRWLGDPYPWHWLLICRRT